MQAQKWRERNENSNGKTHRHTMRMVPQAFQPMPQIDPAALQPTARPNNLACPLENPGWVFAGKHHVLRFGGS
jgi:hypothetical protein